MEATEKLTWKERLAKNREVDDAVLAAVIAYWRRRQVNDEDEPTWAETAEALAERLATVKRVGNRARREGKWPEDLKPRPHGRGKGRAQIGITPTRFGELRVIAAYYALAQTARDRNGESIRPSTSDVADAVGISQPRVTQVLQALRDGGRMPPKLKSILETPTRKGGRGHKRLAA